MRRTILLVVVAATALTCSLIAQTPPEPATDPAERPIEGLPLRRQMLMIQGTVTRIATDAAAEEGMPAALAGLEELQRRIVEAKGATPPRLGTLDESAQQRHDRAFRKALAELLLEAAQLEIAVLDSATERVTASLTRLAELRERGHETFQPPREKTERPRVELVDKVELTAAERQAYAGTYEFEEVGFRISVIERDGHLFLETFGQPAERLYAMGEHAFRVAVSADTEIKFDVGEAGPARAIIIDGGGGRPTQRIERVR